MADLKVEKRGLERSVLVKDGRTVVSEVYTHKDPGDQYETAQLFASASKLQFWLQSLLDAGLSIPEPLRIGAQAALDEAKHGAEKPNN